MKHQDRVYGEFEITEPVILELMSSQVLQRLKGIDQSGYNPFWISKSEADRLKHNRFSHSVGVCLLLRKYGAPLEEQIAGLVHDVSHTAFSHCTEYVLNIGNEEKQTYQDDIFEQFVRDSEIPDILKKYDFDLDYILNDENFPLKEKNLPDLCADRIDYVLRDAMVFDGLGQAGATYFLDNLVAENNIWFFKTFESAKKYAEFFQRMNDFFYAGLPSATMFYAVSDFLKYALEKKYLSEEDLKREDDFVIDKTKEHFDEDEKLRLLFDRMNNKVAIRNNPQDYEFESVCKSRVVDPLFMKGGKLLKLSDAFPEWRKVIEEEMRPKKYFLKFET